jgi:hypothetical protein
MGLFSFFSGYKNIILGLVIVALVTTASLWFAKQKSQLAEAQKTITEMSSQVNAANVARDKALEVARNNEQTIRQLQQEKIDSNAALARLEQRSKVDAQTINKMSDLVKAQSDNPANQTLLSPVLQQTLEMLLAERQRRSGEAK